MLKSPYISILAGRPAIPESCTVWLTDVSQTVIPETQAHACLNAAEVHRASTFRSLKRRHQYVQCHSLLRVLLAEFVGVEAEKITFGEAEFGKPVLSGLAAESGVSFNISHSGSMAVIAISADGEVGVDIEQINPRRDRVGIADHFFAPAEAQAIRAVPCSVQEEAFFSCWCRKESFIKATGRGLHMPLDRFTVNVDPEAAAELIWVDDQEQQIDQWQMHTLLTPAGYLGALTLGVQGVCMHVDAIP